MLRVRRALLSVYDKTGITSFASELVKMGVEIYSTGGTYRMLSESGINALKIEDYTGFPEMMGGRVKTLHPKIHGGILANSSVPEHIESMNTHGILRFDMVVVNLYPFREAVEKGKSFEDIIENIDIGGPSMVRSAAKNFKDTVVVTSPDDYYLTASEMEKNDGGISLETRYAFAMKAFSLTALYDGYISSYFSSVDCRGNVVKNEPDIITLQFTKIKDLRYGENPHQLAAIYKDTASSTGTLISAKQLSGKELSFNNYLDLEAAKNFVLEFDEPVACIMKHTVPCGAAVGANPEDAYRKARECDPVSSFGSIVGFNREVDENAANAIKEIFTEVVIAPSFTDDAVKLLSRKKNLRIIELGTPCLSPEMDWEVKKISGGLLLQNRDSYIVSSDDFQIVTKRKPTETEMVDMLFGQKVVKHVKSNAIVLVANGVTVGIGSGQMSRIDSLNIAASKALKPISGAVLASDAYFPFRDSIDKAAELGIKAIIQPGGSVRDSEVIEAADEYGMTMVFTGKRSFRHL